MNNKTRTIYILAKLISIALKTNNQAMARRFEKKMNVLIDSGVD